VPRIGKLKSDIPETSTKAAFMARPKLVLAKQDPDAIEQRIHTTVKEVSARPFSA
jgi:hypothetical protein